MNKLRKLIKENRLLKNPLIIAIDGPAASGKSTLSEMLKEEYNATIFRMDDFFLPPELKTPERLNEVGGNVHYERFKEEVLLQLHKSTFTYDKYDCQVNATIPNTVETLGEIVVIEGSYALHKQLREYYDIKILLNVSRETQLKRIEKRSPRLLNRFIEEWIPLENKYFDNEKLEDIVDIILEV